MKTDATGASLENTAFLKIVDNLEYVDEKYKDWKYSLFMVAFKKEIHKLFS